jgi:hypothetical protein
MNDISETVAPKSDQLNSDDLIAGPITIKITKVTINLAAPDQPCSLFFYGDNNKPFKPCKSMRRVLINTWGPRSSEYVGRSMTLYRDPTVKFGGFEVGGIRISHMTNIDKPVMMALTASRASRKPFTVHPLKIETAKPAVTPDQNRVVNPNTLELARTAASAGSDVFATWWKSANQDERNDATTIIDEIKETRAKADKEQKAKDAESDEFLSDFVP